MKNSLYALALAVGLGGCATSGQVHPPTKPTLETKLPQIEECTEATTKHQHDYSGATNQPSDHIPVYDHGCARVKVGEAAIYHLLNDGEEAYIVRSENGAVQSTYYDPIKAYSKAMRHSSFRRQLAMADSNRDGTINCDEAKNLADSVQ